MKVKLLLKEDVKDLGRTGDLVEVAAGHARNFLLPKGLALEINASTVQAIEAAKKRRAARELEEKAALAEMGERIHDTTITLAARVSETGTLYGSIAPAQVVAALAEKGLRIEEEMVRMPEHVKALGEYLVPIHLHPEVDTDCTLVVVAEEGSPVGDEAKG
ncbi:MAG: 50S ribosomal protein L9 [Planctomycetota bacterium]